MFSTDKDRTTRDEVETIVELTTAKLELRMEKSLNELRREIQQNFPAAIAREVEKCRAEHKSHSLAAVKRTRWGVQTFMSIIAIGISFGTFLVVWLR
ncbi:MAG: hypothetical protein P8Y00_00220 [Deltaproteobacteria bacterium]